MRRFITFEGGEGSGKTTQIELASAWLQECGIPCLTTAEPGGTPLGRKIREILLNRSSFAIGAEAELLLFAAARAQHAREAIIPALEEGRWVLCDRFADATLAYQGFGRGLDIAFIRMLNSFSALARTPDMTILLDIPVEAGLERAGRRTTGIRPEKAEDRFEQEDRAFHQRIRDGYLALATQEPERFRIVDGTASVDAIQAVVRRHLAALMEDPSASRKGKS